MRITFLLMDAFAAGGTIRATVNTAGALARCGHDVTIASVYRRRRRARCAPGPGVAVVTLSTELRGSFPATPRERVLSRLPSVLVPWRESRHRHFSALTDLRLAAFLRELDCDVLVTTRPGLNIAAARLAARSTLRVGQEHVFLRAHAPSVRRAIARTYPHLDLLTTLTERDAADYRAFLGGQPPVRRMPNGIVLPPVRSSGERPMIVAAGRLTPAKGFDALVAAFALVRRHHPEWELTIHGDGPQRGRLTVLAEQHGVARAVHLPGFTADLETGLADASIAVCTSRREGFGMAVLEAMSVGVPVVAFDGTYGPSELITHGVDGLLVPQGDVAALAAAIDGLVSDPRRRAELGRAARASAERYDVETVARHWVQLLEEARAGSAAHRRSFAP